MEFIETPTFTKWLKSNVSDDEYREFQTELAINPSKGDMIKGTGGFRKARIAYGDHGKRGGGRVIYYWLDDDDQIYLVIGYSKGEKSDLSEREKHVLKGLVSQLKGD
ncbi:MAG: type II toxin-antitoxin system RelE/ParE family toxin [Zhongshania sp.]|uniref:type II toxin-antitoxin system RelE/ParE family toxin n=1 Tax=Zhongshania sp. TaxID=1971902 RepID=UPI0026310EA0|nr:type II toxin-antitoxin system RelE/ParE family toxin [Zhongshania sp.]MDF1693663.1 type II toxin-antitoxin system RelE/ParE family toxin [Zhongshania sp.]